MSSSFVCPSIRAHYLAVQLSRIVDQRSTVRCLSSCVLNNVRSISHRSSCRVLSESSSFLSSYTTSGSDYHLKKRFAHTPHLTQDVVRDTLDKSNNERVLSVKHSNLSEAASSLVDLSASHFDIRNLTREEHDFSIFVPDKLSKLQDISLVKHPIIETALELFDDYKCNSRISLGGFCILLIAKCLQSLPSHTPSQEIWDKQKALAECYELLDKAMYLHHYGVIDIRLESSNNETIKTLNSGNKLAVLSGNYLFSFATHRLAKIVRQPIIFDYVGASIDEFCIKHFGHLQKPGMGKTGHPWADVDMKYWEKYGGYCSTDLLAYSCQSVVMLAELSSVRFERSAFEFGHNLKLLWNLYDDLENLTLKKTKINLISAPFVEYLKQHPVFRDYLVNVESVDTSLLQKIHQLVISNDIIDSCRALLLEYSNQCIQSLEIFPKCPSRDFLETLCREFQDIT